MCTLQALSAHTKSLPAEYVPDFCEVLCSQFRKDVPPSRVLVNDTDTDVPLVAIAIYGLARLLENRGINPSMEKTLLTSWRNITHWLFFFYENFGIRSKTYCSIVARATAMLLAQASNLVKIKALICSDIALLELIIGCWYDAHRCYVDDEGDMSRALANCGSLSDSVKALMIGIVMRRCSAIPAAMVDTFSERVVQAIRWTGNWKALDGYARVLNFFRPIPPETSDYIQMTFNIDGDACDMIELMREKLPYVFPSPEDDNYRFACSAVSGILSFYAFTLEQTYGTHLASRLLYLGFLSNLFVFSGFLNETAMMAPFRDVVTRTLTRTLPRLLGQYSLLASFKDAYFGGYSTEDREKLDRTPAAREWRLFEGFLLERLSYKALFDDNQDKGQILAHCANVSRFYD